MHPLTRLRRRAGRLSMQDLADRSGVGKRTIVRIENRKVQPWGRTLRKLAAVFGCDPDEIVGQEDETTQEATIG